MYNFDEAKQFKTKSLVRKQKGLTGDWCNYTNITNEIYPQVYLTCKSQFYSTHTSNPLCSFLPELIILLLYHFCQVDLKHNSEQNSTIS